MFNYFHNESLKIPWIFLWPEEQVIQYLRFFRYFCCPKSQKMYEIDLKLFEKAIACVFVVLRSPSLRNCYDCKQ